MTDMKKIDLTYRRITDLRQAPWATGFLLRPDERLITESLLEHGWIVPVVACRDGLVVDGNQRLQLLFNDPKLLAAVGDKVPVHVVDCDEVDAMVMHMRLNRGRGMVVAKRVSNLIHEVLAAGRYDTSALRRMLCMTPEEFNVLHDAVYVKLRSIAQHQYSRAWVPIEAPKPGEVKAGINLEYPVNPDN